jgi:hypothetical protein
MDYHFGVAVVGLEFMSGFFKIWPYLGMVTYLLLKTICKVPSLFDIG